MMIGEIHRTRRRVALWRKGDDVATAGAHRIRKVTPKPPAPGRIGDELLLEDTETGRPRRKFENLRHDRIRTTLEVAPENPVPIAIGRDKAPPRSVSTPLEYQTGRIVGS